MSTDPGFLVGEPLGVLQLSGERHLDLGQLRNLGLGLLKLAKQVWVLDGQLLLGGIEVVEGAVGLISPALYLVELVLQLLDNLLLASLFLVIAVSKNIQDWFKLIISINQWIRFVWIKLLKRLLLFYYKWKKWRLFFHMFIFDLFCIFKDVFYVVIEEDKTIKLIVIFY